MEALKENAETLREVYIDDNWVKGEAAEKLIEFIFRA